MRKLFLSTMAVAAVCSASVQARTYSGTVVDAATNEPLIGATVMPVGGGNGVATDIDGKFTLNVPDNVKTATISYVSYTTQTVTLKNGMTVYLAAEASTLQDLVVIGYGTATKESLTGSVSVVDSKQIEDRPVTSVTSALEGNAPGVQVNGSTGQPGSSPSIVIRGIGTVNGNAAICYVVDNVIFNGDISDLNPNDIESMTVLKDAASCAIYGVRAANGVVLITTKKAKKKDAVEVTLQVREGMYTRGLAEYDRLGTNDWMNMTYVQARNYLMDSNPKTYPTVAAANAYLSGGGLINDMLKGNNIFNLPADQLFNENGQIQGHVLPGYTDLDWWDAISRTGMRQEYNMNLASAGDKYNMFASVGYLNEKGYLLRTDFERYNARFNVNVEPVSYLRLGVNLSASYQNSEYNDNAGESKIVNPFATMYYAPIFPYYAHDPETGAILYENGKPMWNMAGRNGDLRNIGYELRHNFSNFMSTIIDANAYATAIIPYGFELTFRGNMFRRMTNFKEYQNNVLGDAAQIGRLTEEDDQIKYHTFQELLNWNHSYGKDLEHNVDVILGHENMVNYTGYNYFTVQQQVEDDYYAAGNFTDEMGQPGGAYGEARTESYFARARYNYLQKYFLEASIRRDGSDRFAKDNRWGTFYSVGASWILTKEKFMQSTSKWLDYAKLRLSYGTVGNYLSAPAQSYTSLYAYYTSMSNVASLIRVTQGNPLLKWEAQKTLDFALEGALFGNRLNFSVGYFDKRSSDLIFNVSPPASIGIQIFSASNSSMSTPINIGSMSNHGWEISFNGTIVDDPAHDFTLGASLDMTFIKNTVSGLPYGGRDLPNGLQRLSEGRSLYEWYLMTYAGVDQLTGKAMYEMDYDQLMYYYRSQHSTASQEELDALWASRLEQASSEGSLIERNGKYYTSNTSLATQTWHGTAMPTVYGSFGLNTSYKGIHLGLLFTYSLGGKVFDSSYQKLMSVSDYTSAMHKDILNSWMQAPEGMTADDPNRIDPNGVPAILPSSSLDNNANSTRFLTNADWLVFKNINISYDLPKRWVNALKLQNINLGFSCDNLFTVAGRKGLNPQQTWSGQQNSDGTFVPSRVFSFQLTARF